MLDQEAAGPGLKGALDLLAHAIRWEDFQAADNAALQAKFSIESMDPKAHHDYKEILSIFSGIIDLIEFEKDSTNAELVWTLCLQYVSQIFPADHLLQADLCMETSLLDHSIVIG
jgi:hypothetical protein